METPPLSGAVLALGRRSPGRVAMHDDRGTVTFGELSRRVAALAAGLREQGIPSAGFVGLLLGNQREHIEALLALDALGAVAVPLDPSWPPVELRRFMEGLALTGVIARSDDLPKLKAAFTQGPLPLCIVVGDADDGVPYERLLARRPAQVEAAPCDEAALAAVALSAGSTGLPKGIAITRRTMLWRLLSQIMDLGFQPGDVHLAVAPLFHGAGRSYALGHLFLGGRLVLMGRFEPERVIETVERERVTTAFFVPTMLRRLLATSGLARRRTATLRVVVSSGAALDPGLRGEALERLSPGLHNVYAAVEAGAIAVLYPEDQGDVDDSVGRPAWTMTVKIVDEADQVLSPNQVGEVICRGPTVASGYLFAEATDQRAFREGWYATGDLGYVDDHGALHVVGRSKETIVSGGKNVQPPEVERVLAAHPDVLECAVIGVAHAEWGEQVTAFVVLRTGAHGSQRDLELHCREHLAAYKVPREIRVVRALPRTSLGKIDRRQLRGGDAR